MIGNLLIRARIGGEGELLVEEERRPAVYCAGPIDYIEHRSPGNHTTDNWRHRFFEPLPVALLCPSCLNRPFFEHGVEGLSAEQIAEQVMQVNQRAMGMARFFVGYFPGDVATFGTPIETWEWTTQAFARQVDPGCIVHPSRPGVFVNHMQSRFGLTVVRSFEEARSWLQHRL